MKLPRYEIAVEQRIHGRADSRLHNVSGGGVITVAARGVRTCTLRGRTPVSQLDLTQFLNERAYTDASLVRNLDVWLDP